MRRTHLPFSLSSGPASGRLALLALACAACRSDPAFGGELELGAGPVVGPSTGVLFSAAQRVFETERSQLYVEVALERQALDAAQFKGKDFDGDWNQVQGGFKLVRRAASEDERVAPASWLEGWNWAFRTGVTWVRADGDPIFVDDPADFGGPYLGVGLEHDLAGHWRLAPDLTVAPLFQESSGQLGWVAQLSLRVLWLP